MRLEQLDPGVERGRTPGARGDVSRRAIWDRVRMAWAMLAGGRHEVRPGRPREVPPPVPDAPALAAPGFAEEALPWIDAVYRFALRLTRGDRDAADDLVQDTFLRAHRFWASYQRGTNAKSWLFTICRTTWQHERERARNQRERAESDIDARLEALAAATVFRQPPADPASRFFEGLIDDDVVEAIDELPLEFREVVVLSDLGDLRYAEIAQVLGVPVGTVRSRLFRGRRLLQERLRDFAVRAGYIDNEDTP